MNNPTLPLKDCPKSPNCVSTEATDARHRILPIEISGDPDTVWVRLKRLVAALPRTTVVETGEDYLRAECRSRLLGFVDDLEIRLDRSAGRLALRSASRTGYSDFGVNRRRVENLRRALQGEIDPG